MAEVAPWIKEEPLPLSDSLEPKQEESLPIAPWVAQQSNVAPWLEQPKKAELPMPGPIDALIQGGKQAITGLGQTAESISGKPTAAPVEQSPAAQHFEWRDLYEPTRGLSKLTYGVGASSPTLAAGVAGGLAGSLVSPGIGTAVGGVGGAAAGAALQTLGPIFSQELQKNPADPDGAWDRAMKSAAASGAFSGASWALFPVKFFSGPVKQLAFQALGVQPGVAVGEKAAHNIIAGDDVTKDLQHAYTHGVVGTAVPAIGHVALTGRFGEPKTRDPNPTPVDFNTMAQEKLAKGTELVNQSMDPNISPGTAKTLLDKASQYHDAASFDLDRAQAPARMAAKLQQAEQLEQQAQAATNPVQADGLRSAARELTREADFEGFIANMAPPMEAPSKTMWGKVKNSYINNVQPEIASDWALRTDPHFAQYKSKQGQGHDSMIAEGEHYWTKWNKVPENDRLEFFRTIETGTQFDPAFLAKHPWAKKAAKDYRNQLHQDYLLEKQMGSKAEYIDNYFPHIWQNMEKARNLFQPERMLQSMGPNWFQKARTYDLIQHGLDNGLQLKSTNPQDLVNNRRMSSVDMVNKMELLHGLERQGVAVPMKDAPGHVMNPKLTGSPHPWEKVTAPNGEQWMIAPDVTALWKNAVEAKGLWAHEGFTGDAFRQWMKVKAVWVPIKLGLSLFHPVHVAHINFVNNMNRAIGETFGSGQQGLARRFVSMPEAVLQSVADTFFLAAPIGTPFIGKRMRESWITPRERQTAQQKADNQLMTEAGISAQLSEQLKIAAKRDFAMAWQNNQYLGIMGHGFRRGMEHLSAPIFEKWIPNLKVASLKREAESLFRRRPDLLTNAEQRKAALRTIGKQIDNRFGEMFYGSLFWNRTMKDAAIGSFLSLGWNLGFVREFGGGFFEPIVRKMIDTPTPTRKLIRDTSNKTTNMVMYSVTAMIINAIMNKGFTGENPEGMDYIFPRIGGLNPDGSPRRITNAFYTREVPMAMKGIEEQQSVAGGLAQMLSHKLMFAPFIEMATNKSFFGNKIYDENSPAFQQVWQFSKHLFGEQLAPMSITGAKRALELSGKPHTTMDVFKQLNDFDAYGSLLGFGPAPAYASKSPLDNRIQYLFRKYVAPESRSYKTAEQSLEKSKARTQYLGAMQRDDRPAQIEAAKKLASLGVPTKEITKLQPGGPTLYMFSRLGPFDQKDLLKKMNKEDFKKFFPKAAKKLRADPDVARMAQMYYQQ